MICFFFTLVTPSDRHEAGQAVPPYENAGKQFLANLTDHLEPLLAILRTDRGQDQMVVILEDAVAEGQRQIVLCLIGGILGGVEPVFHEKNILNIRSLRKC